MHSSVAGGESYTGADGNTHTIYHEVELKLNKAARAAMESLCQSLFPIHVLVLTGFPLTYCYRPRERESRNKEVHDSARQNSQNTIDKYQIWRVRSVQQTSIRTRPENPSFTLARNNL